MSKLIPLPNFYKKAEKLKMSKEKSARKTKKDQQDQDPPSLTQVPNAKMRTFNAITTAANKMITKVKESEEDVDKIDALKNGIQDCVRQFVSISFERAEVNDIIVNQPDFQYLQNYDPTAIFSADLNKVQVAKVMSAISNVQELVVKLTNKTPSGPGVDDQLITRLEKVIIIFRVFSEFKCG